MSTIRHDVTYTQYNERDRIHVEQHKVLYRDKRLTDMGCQRILRASGIANAIVERVETAIQE